MILKTLLKIFGEDYWDLSDEAQDAVRKVVEYHIGQRETTATSLVEKDAQDVLAACHYALAEEGYDWDSIMLNRTRKREVIELRYTICSIFWKHTFGLSQTKKAEMLGGAFDRCTVLNAVTQAENWKSYDPAFRRMYNRMAQNAQEFIEKTENSSEEDNTNN